jgi:hypothetical protein
MLPAAVKIYNGNTANVMDCISEQTMSWSKVLIYNAASRTAAHTHSEMLRARYETMYAFLVQRCLTTAEKVKKTTRSSQFSNTSYQECNHTNNTITTTVKQLYSNLPNTCHGTSDTHCIHQFHQP